MLSLTSRQTTYLRSLAHPLKPLVQVGSKGIADNLIEQIRDQLKAHELIKIRFNTESAVEPAEVADELARRTASHIVQRLGRMLVLYRRHDTQPRIELPKR